MKMRRIPENELARISILSVDEQIIQLRKLKGFQPPYTLNPFRKRISDLMNVHFGLFGEMPKTSWESIVTEIQKSGESEIGKQKNIEVARALFEYSQQHNIVSYSKSVPKWPVGFGNLVAYWNHFYSVWDDKAAFIYFDPRLSNPLTSAARRFAFSVMHQRLRIDDPDFSQTDLLIFRFGKIGKEKRIVNVHSASGVELYNLDELNEMIDITYKLWSEELSFRDKEKKSASGGSTPFGF